MPVDRRFLVLLLAIGSLALWWLIRDDAEAEVRRAHAELARLLSKAEDDTGSAALLNARALQGMFADRCEVTGDAGRLAASYSPEDIARTVVGVHGLYQRIDVSFGDLAIDLSVSDVAIASFSADLVATGAGDRIPVVEARIVTSRMSRVDGVWLFTAFEFEAVAAN